MYLCHSWAMDMAVMAILFIELLELQFHLDPMIESVYIIGTCHFCLHFFFRRDFAVPLSHPLFDPAVPFIAIPLHLAHPAALTIPPPPSPPQIVPFSDYNPLEAVDSSSSTPDDGYTPADLGIANGYLSLESI